MMNILEYSRDARPMDFSMPGHITIKIPALNVDRICWFLSILAVYAVVCYTFTQEAARAQQTDVHRVNERIDEVVRDLSGVIREQAAHEAAVGHPELATQMLAIVEKVELIQLELATLRGQYIGITLVTGALVIIINLANMLGVRFTRNLEPSGGGSA